MILGSWTAKLNTLKQILNSIFMQELSEQIENLMKKCECLIKAKEDLENELKDKIQVCEGLESVSEVILGYFIVLFIIRNVFWIYFFQTVKRSKEVLLKESIRKDSDEIQDLKAELVVLNNENKDLKDKNKVLTIYLLCMSGFTSSNWVKGRVCMYYICCLIETRVILQNYPN